MNNKKAADLQEVCGFSAHTVQKRGREMGKHLTKADRIKLEALLKAGHGKKEIADMLHVHRSTIYREIKRGVYTALNSDLTQEERYSPDIADDKYRENLKSKGGVLKIGSDIKLANYIEDKELTPPFVCLVVSGGHTHLVVVKDYDCYEIIGRTRDDAAGEAFDKVARAIGLGYPGGPKIDKAAREGNPEAIHFPRAKVADAPYDFSFSGVKSAVLNYLNGCKMKGEPIIEADVAASFQQAVCEVLVSHAVQAVKDYHLPKLALAGGVASNSELRRLMKEACEREGIAFYYPSPGLCTDNAAMIGAAAYYEYQKGTRHGLDLNAVPNLKLLEC